MINVIKGNVLHATENIIAHQVNCKGVMGSGVARGIRNNYPAVFKSYKMYCDNMGSKLLGMIQVLKMNDGKRICNLFGQDSYGLDKQYTDVEALDKCFSKLFEYAKTYNLTIAMPYGIGCGRGGADWVVVYSLIEAYSDYHNLNVTLYEYKE